MISSPSEAPAPARRSGTEPSALPPPPCARPSLGTPGALLLAVSIVIGAIIAQPVPVAAMLAVVVLAVAARHPGPLVVGAGLLASLLGARAVAGLSPPPRAEHRGTVTLVTDPEIRYGTVSAVVRAGSHRWEAEAEGAAAEIVRTRLAGEQIVVVGRTGPLPPDTDWLAVQHVSGRLSIEDASPGPPAAAPWRIANRLRRLLAAGSRSLSDDHRALYAGLVLGDDRDQSAELVDDFRGAGLTHLLAVSGQNVAFVLALLGPGLRRLRLGPRLVVTISALALFACTTRFEPSVLRAVAMAAVAALGVAGGRRVPGLHALALSVAALVLLDPFLVRAVGFRLSVAASAGILVLSPRIGDACPGPRWIVTPLSVTLGAQIAVAPLLVAEFGGVPVASVPANLLAGPVAGLVMMWGLVAGGLAGAVGAPGSTWFQWPMTAALTWIETVAAIAARAGLGQIRAPGAIGAAVATGLVLAATRLPSDTARWMRRSAAVLVVAVLALPSLALARSQPIRVDPTPGVVVWRSGGATVVDATERPSARSVLEGLRLAGVRRIDLLVVRVGTLGGGVVATAEHRARVGRVWRIGDGPGAVARGARWRAGGLEAVVSDGGEDTVAVTEAGRSGT